MVLLLNLTERKQKPGAGLGTKEILPSIKVFELGM